MVGVAHEFAPDGTQIGRATLWDQQGNATKITGLGDLFANPWGINSSGTYVGLTRVVIGPNAGQRGTFVGRDGWAVPMSYPGYDLTRAYDINDDGWIVGVYNQPGTFTPHRGYVAKAFDTEIRDLGLLDDPLVNGVWPHEINNAGEIVGAATSGNAFRIALYWPAGATEPIDLNTVVSIPGETRLVEAMDINNSGQILARGFNGYYILTPRRLPVLHDPYLNAAGLEGAGPISSAYSTVARVPEPVAGATAICGTVAALARRRGRYPRTAMHGR